MTIVLWSLTFEHLAIVMSLPLDQDHRRTVDDEDHHPLEHRRGQLFGQLQAGKPSLLSDDRDGWDLIIAASHIYALLGT
jgi:hypothetical protein